MRSFFLASLLLATTGWTHAQSESDPYAEAIDALKAVRNEGEGNEAASAAWKKLVQSDATMVVPLLESMGDASGLAANWVVSAAQAIVDRELAAKHEMPLAELGAFLMDTRQAPRARRWAFELIQRVDPETAEKLVPGMLNDPSTELRRDAVAGLLDEAAALSKDKKSAASIVYRQALGAARDVDQIEMASKALKELGQALDLPQHFGFLMRWKVIGPFHNNERKGFAEAFPPETEIDLDAEYDGKDGKVSWAPFDTSDDYGMVDVNKVYGNLKDVTAYAYTEYEAANDQPAELRLGCKNGWKIWLNGELVFGRDEYHRGMSIDQYKLPISLKKGKNTILVKLCQNEQTEEWTVQWQFQLRVCDATGTALLAVDRQPTPKAGRRQSGAQKS